MTLKTFKKEETFKAVHFTKENLKEVEKFLNACIGRNSWDLYKKVDKSSDKEELLIVCKVKNNANFQWTYCREDCWILCYGETLNDSVIRVFTSEINWYQEIEASYKIGDWPRDGKFIETDPGKDSCYLFISNDATETGKKMIRMMDSYCESYNKGVARYSHSNEKFTISYQSAIERYIFHRIWKVEKVKENLYRLCYDYVSTNFSEE